MTTANDLLIKLISTSGLSGYESTVRRIIADAWTPLTDELAISRLGSLHSLKRGEGSDPLPSILLAAHMDAIGMMVTRIVDGFLYFTEIGGIDDRVLPGQPVTVHGREDLPSLIAQPPFWLLPPGERSGPVSQQYLLVDTGLPPRRVSELVRVGDLISFAQQPVAIDSDTLAGHSLDNRASVVALTNCLENLQKRRHLWDVWAVATAQEEETLGGAATSAFELKPDIAVAVDVTFGGAPGTPNHKTFELGKGPVLSWGPNTHPGLYKAFKDAADRIEMSTQKEINPRPPGTDAFMFQITSKGIPSMIVSIPLRYMHTPLEMVSVKDITRVGRLLAEFIAGLGDDFMDSLEWN